MRYFFLLLICSMSLLSDAQENLNFQKPSKEILDLVDVPLAPYVIMDEAKENMILIYRDQFKSIEELSKEELRLAGLRIDPVTNIGSRTSFFTNMKIRRMNDLKSEPIQIKGLPKNPKISNLKWSTDQSMMAFTHTNSKGVELWLLDLKTATAKKLTNLVLTANMGNVINWFKDDKSMLVTVIPQNKKPLIDKESAIPTGPTISVNDGKKAQNRTYQDLLKNKNDEFNFEQLASSEIYEVGIDGTAKLWLKSDMYRGIDVSPDGKYELVTTVKKPFSYLVPYYRFPSNTSVYNKSGKLVNSIVDVPLTEELPQGFMAERTGRRDINWRDDKPSTLMYVEALDGGDPENKVEFKDEVFLLEAPFNGTPKSILRTKYRFNRIIWGNDDYAIAYDYWWNTRMLVTTCFSPEGNRAPKMLSERNYQDRYNDPGNFETVRNENGMQVLMLNGTNAYLLGDGFSEKGQFPDSSTINLNSGETKKLYTSTYTDKIEDLRGFDPKKKQLLVRIESPSDYPNYYFRNVKSKKASQLTNFKNPFQVLAEVHKEVITYKRDDGLELSGTLYLPVGYDKTKKEKLPMILWAYPREFKDRASASQNTKNPNEFTYPFWGSPLYWLTKGYEVLDDAAFPIIGEGDEEPNDSFRKQLVADAKAAIDAVDGLGYIDRNKVAVGGHSYGAFMVANLLTHSDLFAAGIARSGAYNRTLTPFGFQSEERNYWEAPEVYYNMSPFMHADKMKTPLLLIHGEADNNSGTYPMQSERYFNALKGLGATVRLVMLPKESHGYAAKENILHMLWEQDQWLDTYVKNTKAE